MKENKQETFEEATEKLKKIVDDLSGGNVPLDKSLEMFEEGVRLVRLCNLQLDKAEQRVKMLSLDSDGNAVEKDFVKEGN